jgi:DNA-binding FadR family transcriptional regulator
MTAQDCGHGVKAAERVAAELRRVIVTGDLRPGDRLATERELQAQFDISRPTLREALRLLERFPS